MNPESVLTYKNISKNGSPSNVGVVTKKLPP